MEIYGYKFDELSELDQRKVRETAEKLQELYRACRQRKPMMRAGAMPCDVSPDEPGKPGSDGMRAAERPELLEARDCEAAQLRSRLLRSKLRSRKKDDSNGFPLNLVWEKKISFQEPPPLITLQTVTDIERSRNASVTVPCKITTGSYHELRSLTLLTNRIILVKTYNDPGKPHPADEAHKNELASLYWKRSLIAFLTKEPKALRRNIDVIKSLTGETGWDSGVRKMLAESLFQPEPFPKSSNAGKLLTLSYPAHASIPNMSNCVELKKCPKGGPNALNFIATTRLSPGDVVLIEDACLWKVSRQGQYELCDYCGAGAALALVPCANCAHVFYCSDACHKAAVSEYHWFECKVFRNYPLSMSATVLLALRIFAIGYTAYRKDFAALYQQFLQMTKKYINPLRVHNASDRSPKARYDSLFAVPLSAAMKKLYDNDPNITEVVNQLHDCLTETIQSTSRTGKSCSRAELSKLLKHYAIILTRNILSTEIKRQLPLRANVASDDGSDALQQYFCGANGLYPLLSLFSVSCNPNMALVCTASNRMALVVIRPVAQDERLTIMGHSMFHSITREERQEAMQQQLKMVCECDACVYDYAQIDPLPEVTVSIGDDLKKIAGQLRSFGPTDPPYMSEFLWLQTLFQLMLTHYYSMRLPSMIGYIDLACWEDIDLFGDLYGIKLSEDS